MSVGHDRMTQTGAEQASRACRRPKHPYAINCLLPVATASVLLAAVLPAPAAERGPAEAGAGSESPAPIVVRGTLLEKSSVPTLESIAPYREALVVNLYEVVGKLGKKTKKFSDEGKALVGKRVLVAQWGLFGGRPVGLEHLRVGSDMPLELRPLDEFKDLQFAKQSNTLGAETLDLPIFFDVGQNRAMKDPATAEKYGLMTYKMKDLHNLRHQIKLIGLGDSRAHKGIKPDEFYPDENKRMPVAYNMSYDSTGLRTAMIVMRDYAPCLPKLEWVVHALSTRATKVGYTGREHMWGFVTSPGLLLDRTNRFADWKPDPKAKPILLKDYEWQAGGCYFGTGPGSRGNRRKTSWGWEPRGHGGLPQERKVCGARRSKIDEELLAEYEACVRLLGKRGVRVLVFIPPMFTDPEKSKGDGEDATSREDYQRLLGIFAGMQKRNPNFFFHDIHGFGDNPYTREHFADKDHLNPKGAAKLTAHLEELRRQHAMESRERSR